MGSEVFRLKSLYLGNTVARGAKVTTNNASTTSTIVVDPEIETRETGANYLIQTSIEQNQFKGTATFTNGSSEVTDFSTPDERDIQNGDIIRFDSDERFFAITGIDGSTVYLVDPYEKFSDEVEDARTGICTLRKTKLGSARYEYAKTLQGEPGMFFDKEKNAWGATGVEFYTRVSSSDKTQLTEEQDPSDKLKFTFKKGVSATAPDLMTVNSTEPRKKLVTDSPAPIADLSLSPLPYPHESLKVYWSLDGEELKLREEDKDYVVNYSQESEYKFPFPAYEDRETAYIKFLDEIGEIGGEGHPQVEPIDGTFEGVFAVQKKKIIEGAEPLITPVNNIIPDTDEIKVNEKVLVKDDEYKIDYAAGVVFLTDHNFSEEIIGSISDRKRVLWDGMSIVRGVTEDKIIDRSELIVDQGFTGIGISDPLYFEDREENHIFPGEGYEIDYTSGSLLFNTPLSRDEAVLASYYVEGRDVESEEVKKDDLRLRKYPLLYGTVRLTALVSQEDENGDISQGIVNLDEGDDYEVSYLTGKIKIFNSQVLSDSVESIEALYTPLSLIHTVLQPVNSSQTTYRMTILNDTLEVVNNGSYIFNVTNPAVAIPQEDFLKKSGDPDKYKFTGDIEEGTLTDVRVVETGEVLNVEGYEFLNRERTITLDSNLNDVELKTEDIVNASYAFESEVLPYAPLQVLFNILEKGSNNLTVEGFDRRDIIKPGDVLRIDNATPDATYYMRVKSVDYENEDTNITFYGSYPEDIYNPTFYVLDKSVVWESLPGGSDINKNVSIGNDTLVFSGNTLELLDSLGANKLLMLNGSDIYLILNSTVEDGLIKTSIFPSVTNRINGDVSVSSLPLYTIGGSNLVTKQFALQDPSESAFKIEYVTPAGFEGNAEIQIDTAKITLIESLKGKVNDDYYEFSFRDYPNVDSLANAIQNTVSTFPNVDSNYPADYRPFKVSNFVASGNRESVSIEAFEEDVTESLPFTVGIIPELYKRKLIRTEKDKNRLFLIDVDRSSALQEDSLLAYRSNISGISYYHLVSSCEYLEEENKTAITVKTNFKEHTVEPGVFISKEVPWVDLDDSVEIVPSSSENGFSLILREPLEGLVAGSLIKVGPEEVIEVSSAARSTLAGSGFEKIDITFNRPLDIKYLINYVGSIQDIKYTEPLFYSLDSDLIVYNWADNGVHIEMKASSDRSAHEALSNIGAGSLIKIAGKDTVKAYKVEFKFDSGREDREYVYITFNRSLDLDDLRPQDITYTFSTPGSIVNFNDGYSRYIITGEHKLKLEEDYLVEGGGVTITEPIVVDDRFRINYQGLNSYPEEEGNNITCSCRYFTELPQGSSVEVYMDFINQDQFYVQTLTERDFIDIEVMPEVEQIAKDKASGGGSGDDVGGDDVTEVYKGGIENLAYLLRDEEIKKSIYLRIYKWYKDRLRNFASEFQLIDGFKFANCQHVIKKDGFFSLKDEDVEDHNYTLTTDDVIRQIDNSFTVFFPVGYEGSSPKYYDRFSTEFKLKENVSFYNLEIEDSSRKKKSYGRVKAENPGWANKDETAYTLRSNRGTIDKTMDTVDYRILKTQETNLLANYDIEIRDIDRVFETDDNNPDSTYNFLKKVRKGDKVKIYGKKSYYDIADIIVQNEPIERVSDAQLSDLKERWGEDSTLYKQLKNLNYEPYEILTLEEGKSFREKNVRTYRLAYYEADTMLKENGTYYPAGSYFDTGFVGERDNGDKYRLLITQEQLEGTIKPNGFRAVIDRSTTEEFPMWDDEGNFGSRLAGSTIRGYDSEKNRDRIRPIAGKLSLAALLPPFLFARFEPLKLFRMKIGAPNEDSMSLEVDPTSVDLRGLNFIEERRVSDTIEALMEGVDGEGERFKELVDITFEKFYEEEDRDFQEGLVFRANDRDSWIEPYDNPNDSDDVISGYGITPNIVYKNFYDPDNIFRHLLREKQSWQLLELVNKDLFYFDDKIARCFIDGTLDFSSGFYGINIDQNTIEPNKFKSYLISSLEIIEDRIIAYENHLRFLTNDSSYTSRGQYGSPKNILTPDIIQKEFTNPWSSATHEENEASSEIGVSYEQTKEALNTYEKFRNITGIYRELLTFWKKRIDEDYKRWVISLEKGVVYQRFARTMVESGPLILGPVEVPAFTISVGSNPPDFTIENLTFQSNQGEDKGLGNLILRYDLRHNTDTTQSLTGQKVDIGYYNDSAKRHRTISELISYINNFSIDGVKYFRANRVSETDYRVLSRSLVSLEMDTRNIVKDDVIRPAEGNTLNVLGVPDHRLYDSRVLFLDKNVTDKFVPESGFEEKPFPVYTKNGNGKKQAIEGLPVSGSWEPYSEINAINIRSIGGEEILVTFDDIDILEEDENGVPTEERVDLITEDTYNLIEFEESRPPINVYSASKDLREILWEGDRLDKLFKAEGLSESMFNRLKTILDSEGVDTEPYVDLLDGLNDMVLFIEEDRDLRIIVIDKLRNPIDEEDPNYIDPSEDGYISPTIYYVAYSRLAAYLNNGSIPLLTPEEEAKLRELVPPERPRTKIIRNMVILRKGIGNDKYILTIDLGKYPTVADVVYAINSASWKPGYTEIDEEGNEVNVPGRYVFGEFGEGQQQHFIASVNGGDEIGDLNIQNLDVRYEPVNRPFKIFHEETAFKPSYLELPKSDIVGWRIKYKSSAASGDVTLNVLQEHYSITDTQNFSYPGYQLAQESTLTRDSVDITPFHVYCWDEPDSEGNRYFRIKENVLYLKSANVDYSIVLSGGDPSRKGETLNQLLARVNGDSNCNEYFYLNLRWDRENKRNEDGAIVSDGTRGYFEYTYLPDQRKDLPKSTLDRINLMRDEVIKGTPSEETQIRIREKSTNPIDPVFDPALPDRVNNTPLSEYPVYRSSVFDLVTKTRAFSVGIKTGEYNFSDVKYKIDSSAKTFSFSGTYTVDKTYEKEFLFSDTSYDTISELVNAINSENDIPELGVSMFSAALITNGDSTDLISTSGSLSAVASTIQKETEVTNVVPNPTPPPATIIETSTIIEDALTISVPASSGSGWEIITPSFSIPATRDRIVFSATLRYSGDLSSITYNTNTFTVTSLVNAINTERHLGSSLFETFFDANVMRPAMASYSTSGLEDTSGFVDIPPLGYGKIRTSNSFNLSSNFGDLIEAINSRQSLTGFVAEMVYDNYADLPSELLIPAPDFYDVTSTNIIDADFRLVTAIELLHMEYLDNTGVYEVTTNKFNLTSGGSKSFSLKKNLQDFLDENKGDYDTGFLSLNVLPILRRDFGKLGVISATDMSQNDATKAYFGIMGDIKYLQISDYDITILLNSAKKRMSKPWTDYTPPEERQDWFLSDGGILKNLHMRDLPNREIAPLIYETEADGVSEDLKKEMTLVEDGVYDDSDNVHKGNPLGLGTEDFLRYLKFDRADQIRKSIIAEQILSNKYLWLYLKFHREFGSDQRVKYYTKKIEQDGEDAQYLEGA
jgi:hypothetical protein